MKLLFLLTFLAASLIAEKVPVDCNKIFELRKAELLREVERIDEQQQAYEAFVAASKAVLKKREEKLRKREQELNATLRKVEETKRKVVEIYDANKKLLEEIQKAKTDKLSATYLKMKESKAAAILDKMPRKEAARILFHLTPKKISKIMAKMDPKIASEVTLLLEKGPPFDTDTSRPKPAK
ncbi:MAG: hypothetical protein B6D59_05605 [Campylobacteraceae bacterium 4484_4]|nr:MAG: hypothetical protein B6D59_05605 [Campylobacteraceae bacterium 4484_4]